MLFTGVSVCDVCVHSFMLVVVYKQNAVKGIATQKSFLKREMIVCKKKAPQILNKGQNAMTMSE